MNGLQKVTSSARVAAEPRFLPCTVGDGLDESSSSSSSSLPAANAQRMQLSDAIAALRARSSESPLPSSESLSESSAGRFFLSTSVFCKTRTSIQLSHALLAQLAHRTRADDDAAAADEEDDEAEPGMQREKSLLQSSISRPVAAQNSTHSAVAHTLTVSATAVSNARYEHLISEDSA